MTQHHPAHIASPFGDDAFGQLAEQFARFFGTPRFIIAQTVVVAAWIAANVVGFIAHWDVYPFILLNLVFSTQAAYAAPLILLAQTRQAERDKLWSAGDVKHREELNATLLTLLEQNTDLTKQVHALVSASKRPAASAKPAR